jgi:hypothetical protein
MMKYIELRDDKDIAAVAAAITTEINRLTNLLPTIIGIQRRSVRARIKRLWKCWEAFES